MNCTNCSKIINSHRTCPHCGEWQNVAVAPSPPPEWRQQASAPMPNWSPPQEYQQQQPAPMQTGYSQLASNAGNVTIQYRSCGQYFASQFAQRTITRQEQSACKASNAGNAVVIGLSIALCVWFSVMSVIWIQMAHRYATFGIQQLPNFIITTQMPAAWYWVSALHYVGLVLVLITTVLLFCLIVNSTICKLSRQNMRRSIALADRQQSLALASGIFIVLTILVVIATRFVQDNLAQVLAIQGWSQPVNINNSVLSHGYMQLFGMSVHTKWWQDALTILWQYGIALIVTLYALVEATRARKGLMVTLP